MACDVSPVAMFFVDGIPYQGFNFQLILELFYSSVTRYNFILIYLGWPLEHSVFWRKKHEFDKYNWEKAHPSLNQIHLNQDQIQLNPYYNCWGKTVCISPKLHHARGNPQSGRRNNQIFSRNHFLQITLFLVKLSIYKDWDIAASPLIIIQGVGSWNLTTFRCEGMNVEASIWQIRSICKFQQVRIPAAGKPERGSLCCLLCWEKSIFYRFLKSVTGK